jgi:MoxR-like ATPase
MKMSPELPLPAKPRDADAVSSAVHDEKKESQGTTVAQLLVEGASKVIIGKRDVLQLLVAALLAKGHIILDDLPGLGKTTVAKTFARLIAAADGRPLEFKRIQFTPDLLPYDITGVDVFDPESRGFRFIPGPILANIVLADEINRTTPKVQSALLEVMAENQVTVGTATHRARDPFVVIATQNPVESEGTFPLPVAQLDRFMMRLSIGYPDRDSELSILEDDPSITALTALQPVVSVSEFLLAREAAEHVYCHPEIKKAIVDIVRDTRVHKGVSLGASPRGGIHFIKAAKALAMVRGRDFVTDEDLAEIAPFVLAHRIKLRDPRLRAELLVREATLERIERIPRA